MFMEGYILNVPKVSVIVPVYNAEKYLRQCLDTIIHQTLMNIEIICVDDGSTDQSLQILKEYLEKDHRIRVISQNNQFAGAARNRGIQIAQGEYLSFLDADDFFETNMLEEAYTKCIEFQADIGLYQARCFSQTKNTFSNADWIYNYKYLPSRKTFSSADIPETIFQITTSAPWNKLFRTDFIKQHGLQFQEIRCANDVYFVNMALVLARKIVRIDKYLINYRVDINTNLQATQDKSPTAFYDACTKLGSKLKEKGIYSMVERSFVNFSLANSMHVLSKLKTADGYCQVYRLLREGGFQNLGLMNHKEDASYFYYPNHYKGFLSILEKTAEEDLFYKWKNTEVSLNKKMDQLIEKMKDYGEFQTSKSGKLGRVLISVPRKIKGGIQCFKEHGMCYTWNHLIEKVKK